MSGRLLRSLALLLFSPFLVLIAALSIAAADCAWLLRRRRARHPDAAASKAGASIVIPTWNGRDLLERNLPSVVNAAAQSPENEIILVDNASTDGTAGFVRAAFPSVKLLEMPRNLGFGGAANAGFRAARNGIVVLLNDDMRVAVDFLAPLMEGFTDEQVFSVSCQIFFTDPGKVREETGLTQGWWESGSLRVRHRADDGVASLFPCFYGGGGSSAFDRAKFLELGGFDPLFEPFYLEDADLGYVAWKRGWKVFYEPRSVVWHEHRGTIGRRFSQDAIRSILAKNFILWSWKNVHAWPRLMAHFAHAWSGAVVSTLAGDSPERASLDGLWRAFRQLPGALRSRSMARELASVSDTEAFRRPLGGYFRDRFHSMPADPRPLRVLFVSPYPIVPPVHGGGVFMYQTLQELVRRAEVHLVALVHWPHELPAHERLRELCASAEFLVKTNSRPAAGSLLPHAVREFAWDELAWLIHRQLFLKQVDVLQLEYTAMAQYAGCYRRIASVLFEHDVYFQSIARGWSGTPGALAKMKAAWEYLRALRWETRMLPRLDDVQACSRENAEYLLSFMPDLDGRVAPGLRAGINTALYSYRDYGREPDTLLFLGSFRHLPNQSALRWFTGEVLPRVAARRPDCRLVVVGSDPPPPHALPNLANVEFRGFVEEIREPLARYAVFVCPVLSGSGVRVKLLEAFAAGIPAVSTRLGAEGLAKTDGEFCALADSPEEFAAKILSMLDDPERAVAMSARARAEVEAHWDMASATGRLEASYREIVRRKRGAARAL